MPAAGDGQILKAEWQPWGPIHNSFEVPGPRMLAQMGTAGGVGSSYEQDSGFLSVDHSDGVDTRWNGIAIMGPSFTSLSLAGVGGTPANANSIDVADSAAGGLRYAYVARGTRSAKVDLADMTAKDSGFTLAERVTQILVTKNGLGNQEVTSFMNGTAYDVISSVATSPAADTHATNTTSTIIRVGGNATDRIAGFNGNIAYGNTLSGSITMAAPNWITVATYWKNIVSTGFAMNRAFWVWGTNRGPLMVNNTRGAFVPLFDELPPGNDNCRAMRFVPYLGTVIPLINNTRSQDNLTGQRIGTEIYLSATNPVQGRVMGQSFDPDWTLWAYLNPFTSTTYFVMIRPRQPSENHTAPNSMFVIGSQSTACEVVKYIGVDGSQTQPIWMVGDGSDVKYFKGGLTQRWPDDSNYLYSTTTQNLYLTELRRESDMDKEVAWVEFEAVNCNANQTIRVDFAADGGSYTTIGTVNNASTTGTMVRMVPDQAQIVRGWRMQPRITFTNNTTASSPYIRGRVRVYFRMFPRRINDTYAPEAVPSMQGTKPRW